MNHCLTKGDSAMNAEKRRKKLEADIKRFEESGGKIKTEEKVNHTVQSVKATYEDNPKNYFQMIWSDCE
jgi:hypothetical protein